MTPTKILLAGAAMVSLLIMFATRPVSAPPVEKDQSQVNSVRTLSLAQMSFETPSWVPDEATKKKALLRAYELNGNKMCCGSIDVSHENLTEHVTADAPAHAAAEVVDPNERNTLDAQAEDKPDWDARRRFMNRTFRAIRDRDTQPSDIKSKTDVCKRHGLHKVIYGDRWRCRK